MSGTLGISIQIAATPELLNQSIGPVLDSVPNQRNTFGAGTAGTLRQFAAANADDAVFRDSSGPNALPHDISNAQKFVPGFRLELAGAPEQGHARMPDGNVMGRGTNFGRLSSAGFRDKP